MKNLVCYFCFIFYSFIFCSYNLDAQTQTVSKSCGNCKKSVSEFSKIGDICPYCGVRWGYENSTSSTYQSKKYSSNFTSNPNAFVIPNTGTLSSQDMSYASTTIHNSNLRSGSRLDSEILGVIPKNSNVIIKRIVDDWVKIEFTGRFIGEELDANNLYMLPLTYHGWIHKSNLIEE